MIKIQNLKKKILLLIQNNNVHNVEVLKRFYNMMIIEPKILM